MDRNTLIMRDSNVDIYMIFREKWGRGGGGSERASILQVRLYNKLMRAETK